MQPPFRLPVHPSTTRARAAGGCAWLLLVTFVGAAKAATSSDAALPELELEWPTLVQCPSSEQVRLAVKRQLSGELRSLSVVRAKVEIEAGEGFSLRLVTQTALGSGERRLQGDNCVQVADATAVILAMMMAPDAAETRVDPTASAPLPVPEGSREVTVSTPNQPKNDPSVSRRNPHGGSIVRLSPRRFELSKALCQSGGDWRLMGGGTADYGLAREWLFGATLAGSLDYCGMRWTLQGGYAPRRRIELSNDHTRGADVDALRGALSMGPIFHRGRWTSVPHAGAAFHALYARGVGVDEQQPSFIYWWSLALGYALNFDVEPDWSILVGIDLERSMHRPKALLDPGGTAIQPDRLTIQSQFGAAMRF